MSLWQSAAWASMLQKTHQVETNLKIGTISVQKRSIGLGQYALFVMGLDSFTKGEQQSLIELCKKESTLFVQVESLSYTGNLPKNASDKFQKGSYKKFITPYTAIIDLQEEEEETLKKMKPKGRYNIKLATKKGVRVEKVEKSDANIQLYHSLSQETTLRDNFSGHSFDYYKNFLHTLPQSELYLARKDGEVIAGGIFVFDQDVSYYYYGASTSKKEFRNLMAPYLLQWEAIREAKALGSKIYDFLGVSGEGDFYDPSLIGVTDFKKKLSPRFEHVSDCFIYINNPIKYKIIKFLKQLKSSKR